MILLAVCFGFGQLRTELLTAVVESRREQQQFTGAYETLSDTAELAALDRGFRAFVEARPQVALAERAHQGLLALPSYRSRVAAFEEALRAEDRDALFRRYYGALAVDAELRKLIEDLVRLELRERTRDERFGEALAYLRRRHADAVDFLEHPTRFIPTPAALWPLRNRLRRDEVLRDRLLGIFRELDARPATHAAVYPWWETAYDAGSETGARHRALVDYLGGFPHRFWTWHRRNVVWADFARAAAWRDYWYGRVRREEGLGEAYFTYVDVLGRAPVLADNVERGMNDAHGPARPWPPEGAPPELGPWFAEEDTISEPALPDGPAIDRPNRPRVPRPETGQLPRPQAPERPDRPNPDVREAPE